MRVTMPASTSTTPSLSPSSVSSGASQPSAIVRPRRAAVAPAAHRIDQVVAQSTPQLCDVLIDGPFGAEERFAPDAIEQLAAAEDAPRMGGQEGQQLELPSR